MTTTPLSRPPGPAAGSTADRGRSTGQPSGSDGRRGADRPRDRLARTLRRVRHGGPTGGARRAERSRAELWRWPAAAGLVALVGALLLAPVRPDPATTLSRLAWPGDVDSASTVLQVVAASSVATITLTFSLTVLALQLASQQFSPRLLRDFTRDRITKAVLAVLMATFVFALTTLRQLRADQPVPAPALLVTFVLTAITLVAILAFIGHITRMLRVDTMMTTVHGETVRAIDAFYPAYDDPGPRSPDELGLDAASGASMCASSSGFVRMVDVAHLVQAAEEHDGVVVLEVRPGDQVVQGTPVATLWARHPQQLDSLQRAVRSAVVMGYERTVEQDAAFGFRQLTDIAVKALSPGINDPVTAAHSIGHSADLLVRLTGKRLGATLHEDSRGVGRVVVGDRDLRYYLDLVCGQVRRYGENEPTVLVALLRMLRDVATHARDHEQRAEVDRQVRLVLDALPPSLERAETERVRDLADRVAMALRGDVAQAYRDRSGETRSL